MIFGALFGPSRRMLQRFVDSRLYGIRLAYQRRPGDMTPIPAGVLGGRDLAAYGEMTLLGRGGMAEVYLAIHPRLRCPGGNQDTEPPPRRTPRLPPAL